MRIGLSQLRVLLGTPVALALSLSFSVHATPLTDSSCLDDLVVRSLVERSKNTPNAIGVRTIPSPDGDIFVMGFDRALPFVGVNVASVKRTMDALTLPNGRDTHPKIILGRALTGSLARYALLQSAGDLDLEAVLLVRSTSSDLARLHQPRSQEIRELVTYVQESIESVLKAHPEFRFIELKAGEYKDPTTGETKGVKWWLSDIRRGYKFVNDFDPSGKPRRRRLSLAQAFAEDARIKADWAIPSIHENSLPGAYMEASILYRMGVKVGNNQPRLRLSEGGMTESLPLRITTITLDPQDMWILSEVSQAAPRLHLEDVHARMMEALEKYQTKEPLKVFKRAYGLLQFWESIDDYNRLAKVRGVDTLDAQTLNDEFLSVIRDEELRTISEIRSQAELLVVLDEHQIDLPARSIFLESVRSRFGLAPDADAHAVVGALGARINQRLALLLESNVQASRFMAYILERLPAFKGPLTSESVFLAQKPNAAFLARYAKRLNEWKKRYPALEFVEPEDLHMTIKFMGRMPEPGVRALAEHTQGAGEGWKFVEGGARIFGRNHSLVALEFKKDASLSETVDRIRGEAVLFGARPENDFPEFTPHLTLARIRDHDHGDGVTQASLFLQENLTELQDVVLEAMQIWTRNPKGRTVYRIWK